MVLQMLRLQCYIKSRKAQTNAGNTNLLFSDLYFITQFFCVFVLNNRVKDGKIYCGPHYDQEIKKNAGFRLTKASKELRNCFSFISDQSTKSVEASIDNSILQDAKESVKEPKNTDSVRHNVEQDLVKEENKNISKIESKEKEDIEDGDSPLKESPGTFFHCL